MSIEIFRSNTIEAEQWARDQRKEGLRDAFAQVSQLIINTGKYDKAKAAMDIVVALIDPAVHFDNGRVLQLPSTQDEPALERAIDAATYKAKFAKDKYLTDKFPELMFLLKELNIALQANLNDQLIQELLKGIIFVGGDINSFIASPETGELEQHHKLERKHAKLKEIEYMALRESLYRTYVRPKTGKIRVVWEISTATINGSNHNFTDFVEIIADPIDPELLELYLKDALANGMILKSNTHLEVFEMLCASNKIRTTSKVPRELADKGYGFAQFRQSPKQEELQAILHSINSNAPVYVA